MCHFRKGNRNLIFYWRNSLKSVFLLSKGSILKLEMNMILWTFGYAETGYGSLSPKQVNSSKSFKFMPFYLNS